MNDIHRGQIAFFPQQVPQFDLSQWRGVTAQDLPPIAQTAPQLSLAQINAGGRSAFSGVGYVAYKIIVGPQERRLHCSECGRASHTARNCPFTGERSTVVGRKDGLVRVLWRLVPSDATPSLRRPRRRFESNGDVPRVPRPLRSRRAYSLFCNQTSLLPGWPRSVGGLTGRLQCYTSDHEGLDQRGERLPTVPEVGEVLCNGYQLNIL